MIRRESNAKSKEYSHWFWRDRVAKEDFQTFRSLAKGIELGLVNQLPCMSTGKAFTDEGKYEKLLLKKESFASVGEIAAKSNPLSTVIYHPKDEDIYQSVDKVLREYSLSPTGLQKKTKNVEVNLAPVVEKRRHYSLNKPVGKKIYKGNELRNYMRSSIDLSQPEINHVCLKASLSPRDPPHFPLISPKHENIEQPISTPSKPEEENVNSQKEAEVKTLPTSDPVLPPIPKMKLHSSKKYEYPDVSDSFTLRRLLKLIKQKEQERLKKKSPIKLL